MCGVFVRVPYTWYYALRSRDHRILERVEKGAPEVCADTGTQTLTHKKILRRKTRGERPIRLVGKYIAFYQFIKNYKSILLVYRYLLLLSFSATKLGGKYLQFGIHRYNLYYNIILCAYPTYMGVVKNVTSVTI